MLNKEASSTIFWIFGMTRQGVEPQSTHNRENKWVHAFHFLKVNVIELLEFELAYSEAEVQHFSHLATGSPE